MEFDASLQAAEERADSGDLTGALSELEALRPGLTPQPAGQLHLLLGALTARTGDLEGAIPHLERSLLLANVSQDVATALEARVTHASVLGALGLYDEAIPMLGRAVNELEAHPELAELRGEARAELRSYRNLVSPKTAATWASLLT